MDDEVAIILCSSFLRCQNIQLQNIVSLYLAEIFLTVPSTDSVFFSVMYI